MSRSDDHRRGVTEHANSAVLVTVAPGGELLDRRSIDLTRAQTFADSVMYREALARAEHKLAAAALAFCRERDVL